MTDRQTPYTHARAAEADDAGFDVWLPAIVAFAAALFLILSANAQEAPPRPIYNAERFTMSEAERTLLEEQDARAAAEADEIAHAADRFRAANARVEMRALPEIHAVIADASAAVSTAEARAYDASAYQAASYETRYQADRDQAGNDQPGWLRLVMALTIAAMLGGALYLLDRTWRRTGPLLPNEQAPA